MLYVEDKNGKVVDGHIASEIRKYARSVWVHIAKVYGAPPKWSDAGVKIAQVYHEHMYSRFLFLQLCELDWKVDLIATDNYPLWHSYYIKKLKTDTKAEQVEVALSTIAEDSPPKHAHGSSHAHDLSSEPLPKRTKVIEKVGIDAQPNQDITFQFQVCA
jgi:hypothetical protein